MNRLKLSAIVVAFALVVVSLPALGSLIGSQDQEMPKPGPEHELLAKSAGTWDATVEMMGQTSKGVETVVMGCGGFWQLVDFKGEFGGGAFHGHGMTGYDPGKKKYVSVWGDSMSPTLSSLEGTVSEDGKVWTFLTEGPDMTGQMTKFKHVTKHPDADTRVFTIFAVRDGKDAQEMQISYKRKK